MPDIKSLQKKLGYEFKDPGLLEKALIHSSYANENRGLGLHSNERLEFLGDSVLGMISAEFLYRTFPRLPEGELTRTRAALVCEQSLAETAKELSLGSYLSLGRGEEAGGGRERISIIADAMESVFAAVYLDGGKAAAEMIIKKLILSKLGSMKSNLYKDYKTLLQEQVQKEKAHTLSYRLIGDSGPDHDKRFTMEVLLDGVKLGEGTGMSKKEAEQYAARAALEKLGASD